MNKDARARYAVLKGLIDTGARRAERRLERDEGPRDRHAGRGPKGRSFKYGTEEDGPLVDHPGGEPTTGWLSRGPSSEYINWESPPGWW